MRFSMPNGWVLSGCRMFFQAGAMVLVSSAANRREAAKSNAANRNRRSTTDFIEWFSFTYGVPGPAGQIFSPRAAGMPRNPHAESVRYVAQPSLAASPGGIRAAGFKKKFLEPVCGKVLNRN